MQLPNSTVRMPINLSVRDIYSLYHTACGNRMNANMGSKEPYTLLYHKRHDDFEIVSGDPSAAIFWDGSFYWHYTAADAVLFRAYLNACDVPFVAMWDQRAISDDNDEPMGHVTLCPFPLGFMETQL